MEKARAESDLVIVYVHRGEENTSVVAERQRELARWLVNHGADLIVGSHPHCVQPLDFFRGRPIVYSLGNLVFDGAPTLRSWNKGELLEVNLDGASPALRFVPIKLDRRGFPHLVVRPAETAER